MKLVMENERKKSSHSNVLEASYWKYFAVRKYFSEIKLRKKLIKKTVCNV